VYSRLRSYISAMNSFFTLGASPRRRVCDDSYSCALRRCAVIIASVKCRGLAATNLPPALGEGTSSFSVVGNCRPRAGLLNIWIVASSVPHSDDDLLGPLRTLATPCCCVRVSSANAAARTYRAYASIRVRQSTQTPAARVTDRPSTARFQASDGALWFATAAKLSKYLRAEETTMAMSVTVGVRE